MSSILTDKNRGNAFTVVGSPEGLAENFWSEWQPASSSGSLTQVPDTVNRWVSEYLEGVRSSVARIMDRELTVVTGADALAGFWATHNFDRAKPTALANLARLVFNLSREVEIVARCGVTCTLPVVILEASRLRFPGVKLKREAKADRTLSSSGNLADQLSRSAQELPQGCQLILIDDRLQSGGTLSTLQRTAQAQSLLTDAIIVAHSELPAADVRDLLPGAAVYAHVFDYAHQEEKQDWVARHKRGEVRLPLSDELHDLLSVSPASGEVIVNRYMDAFPQLTKIYQFLKSVFKEIATKEVTADRDISDLIDTEALKDLGAIVVERDKFLRHMISRSVEHREAKISLERNKSADSDVRRGCEAKELKARWGARDIDLLFSHNQGCLKLRDHPQFNTDIPDKRRYGAFFPFPHRDSLTATQELRRLGALAWAEYSFDELTRSIQFIDQWQGRFGALNPLVIPHLAAPAVQRIMGRLGKSSALDQLGWLRDELARQMKSSSVSHLV